MTLDELQQIKKIIGDMRFMQAAALVASGLSDSKESIAYMRNLARMEKLVQYEIEDAIKRRNEMTEFQGWVLIFILSAWVWSQI